MTPNRAYDADTWTAEVWPMARILDENPHQPEIPGFSACDEAQAVRLAWQFCRNTGQRWFRIVTYPNSQERH